MRCVVLCLIAVFWSSMAAAQSASVPAATADPMMSMCSGLLTESGAGMTGKDKLCRCLINEVTAKLTVDEMTAYAQANANSQTPPQAVMDKVTGIATGCLNQSR
jgi:hypothetical protein